MAIHTPAASSPLMTQEQAAKYLGLGPKTLEVWRSRGTHRIPFVKVGRLVRYLQTDLDKWIDAHRRTVA